MKNWLNKYQDAGEVIYVDDPNDPRLLDYQTRQNLWKYSQIPNMYHLDKLGLDEILSGDYTQAHLTKDWISDRYNPTAYDTHMYGPYGSKNEIRDIPIDQLDAFRNNPELARQASIDSSFYRKDGRDILKKYPPSRYRGMYEYTNFPYQDLYPNRGRQFFGTDNYMIAPRTQFIEDNIDRELLRKTYPNLTDEFVDAYVKGEREFPTYYTNKWDPHPDYQWYSYADAYSPAITPGVTRSDSTVIDTVDGLYPKTHDILYSRYGDYDLNGDLINRTAKGYLQEGVTHDIEKFGKYYPVWDKPTQVFELRKPAPKPPKTDREIIQIGDSPYEKGSRKFSKAVQNQYPGLGTHEYADQVRIGTDLYPVTHSGDRSYGEFEIDGKKQYITYEKNPEGGYTPTISETQPEVKETKSAKPKVVKAPTFKSGGWLDTYDSMTPAWSKNPEGNWVVKAQKGLSYSNEPTRADSLELLNNARMVSNYYLSNPKYTVSAKQYLKNDAEKQQLLNDVIYESNHYDESHPRTTPSGPFTPLPKDQYYKKVDKNKFYQRETANYILDTRAPVGLYDKRIKPTMYIDVNNTDKSDVLSGDHVSLIGYDPLSVTPWDMLTEAQKKLRIERFGVTGTPEDPNNRPALQNIKPLPIKLLEAPQDRLIREYNTMVPNEDYRRVYDKSPYSVKNYGPDGQPTHWAKEDEKIPGVWRPIKGTPSDLLVSKRVKFQKGGVNQKIYTDPKDFAKADRAYRDSLDLYTKSFDFHNKHIPTDNYNSFSVPYDDVYWTAAGPGGYFIDIPSGRWFLGKTGVFSWPGSEHNKIFTESFANKIKPIGFDSVDWPYPVYKKPTQQPVYKEEIKNLPYLDAKFERPDFKLDIGRPAVKSQGIRIRPMMTADQKSKTGQYQSGKYYYDQNTKSWKVQTLSPETQRDNREEVRIGIKRNGGWLDTYQNGSQVKTYESDPSYFDNRAVFVDNPQANDLVRSKVYAGTHGWDPATNSLVKLDKPVAVPEAVREMSTADWGKKSSKERFESDTPAGKATRKAVAAREMEQAVTNPYFRGAIPAMMLPGLPALGEAAYAGIMSTPIGSATAGALGSSIAPGLTYGTLGQGLVDSYFASSAMGHDLPSARRSFQSGDIMDGAAHLGVAGMNLLPFMSLGAKEAGKSIKGLNNFLASKKGSLALPYRQSTLTDTLSPAEFSRLRQVDEALSLKAYNTSNKDELIRDFVQRSSLTDDEITKIFGKSKDELINFGSVAPVSSSPRRDLGSDLDIESLRRRAAQIESELAPPPAEISIDDTGWSSIQGGPDYSIPAYQRRNVSLNASPSGLGTQRITLDDDILGSAFANLDLTLARQPKYSIGKELWKNAKGLFERPTETPDVMAVPHLSAHSFSSKRDMMKHLNSTLGREISDAPVGSIITGSTNTSYNSYLPQIDYIFKNAGKQGLSKPVFLGYRPMNMAGFLSGAGVSEKEIFKYINNSLNKIQKRGKLNLNLGTHKPFIATLDTKNGYPGDIMLPQWGVRKIDNSFKLLNKQDGGDYTRIPKSWKDTYEWSPNVEEEYQNFKADPNAPENLRFTDDMNDYNTRGMWDSLDRPSDWQQALALYKQQQGEDWTPEDDGYYHAWSQHPGTGEWLKPKHHSTGWMNYMGYAFDPDSTAVVNPEGFFGNETLQSYPKQKKKGGESQGEGYYDYINGYSGIFAKGGTKGWLDNYN